MSKQYFMPLKKPVCPECGNHSDGLEINGYCDYCNYPYNTESNPITTLFVIVMVIVIVAGLYLLLG